LDLRVIAENTMEFTLFYCAIRIWGLYLYLPHIAYIPGLGRLFHTYADLFKSVKLEGTDPKTQKKYTVFTFTVIDFFVSILGLCMRPISISLQNVKEIKEEVKKVEPEVKKDISNPDVEIKKEEDKPLEIPKK
jgi:hypothetical protein